jgi:hypothetical protein
VESVESAPGQARLRTVVRRHQAGSLASGWHLGLLLVVRRQAVPSRLLGLLSSRRWSALGSLAASQRPTRRASRRPCSQPWPGGPGGASSVCFVTSCATLLCGQPCSTPTRCPPSGSTHLARPPASCLPLVLLLLLLPLYFLGHRPCPQRRPSWASRLLGLPLRRGCRPGATRGRIWRCSTSLSRSSCRRMGRVAVENHRALEVRLRAVMAGRGSEASCDFCASSCRGVEGCETVPIALQPHSAPCEVSKCCSFFCPDDATCLQLLQAQFARTRTAAVASNARHAWLRLPSLRPCRTPTADPNMIKQTDTCIELDRHAVTGG